MQVLELPLRDLRPAVWNANTMSADHQKRLGVSLARYGLVQNLVVRPVGGAAYEVLSGNQRLQLLQRSGTMNVPCVVIDLDDAQARLFSQALNHIHGEDDLGLRAGLIRQVLKEVPEADVLALLPETAESLKGLETLGLADLTEHLRAWELAQAAKLKCFTAQLTGDQLQTVEHALDRAGEGRASDGVNPNRRGNALYLLCKEYLEVNS